MPVAKAKTIVAHETAPMVALSNPKGLNPTVALDAWGKTQSIDAKTFAVIAKEVDGILSDSRLIRATFYTIGQRLVSIRDAIASEPKWVEFRDKVLPSLGISRTNCWSLIGRVETMQVKFPHATVRNLLVEATNGRRVVNSQTGNLEENAQKALDAIGPISESASQKDAQEYVAKFQEELGKLNSKPAPPSGAESNKYTRKRDACTVRFVAYKKMMDSYREMDALKASHGAAEDIEDLFVFFLNCKPTPDYVEKLSNRLATLLKRSGIVPAAPATK